MLSYPSIFTSSASVLEDSVLKWVHFGGTTLQTGARYKHQGKARTNSISLISVECLVLRPQCALHHSLLLLLLITSTI